jgi:MYXO-CTERM domain-containing protein
VRVVLAIVLGALVLGAATSAQAYLLVETDDGTPVHWQQRCVPWKLHELGSADVGFDLTHEAMTQATDTWEEISSSFITFEDQGVTSKQIVTPAQGEIENIVIWHEDAGWPYALRVVGLTSLTFDSASGQIIDADIEMNGDDYDFGVDGGAEVYDIQQALTHELGHLLGLDHSLVEAAAMFPDAFPGEVQKRVLHGDDVDAVSETHPSGSEPEVDGCDAPAVLPKPVGSGGCDGGGSTPGVLWPLALGMVALLRRRRPWEVLLLAGMVSSVVAAPAWAGSPYTTEDGTPIYWPAHAMVYTLHPDLPDGLEESAVEEAIGRGFDAWEHMDCHPLSLDSGGWSTCPGELAEDDVNCIRWRDRLELWAWSTNLVAVTLVHYWEDTAVIEDVDIEINAFNVTWSTDLECQDEHHDLVATITHEAGHFVGLDHSLESQATMNAATTAGDCQKRSLEDDDKETFCATYEDHPEAIPEPAGDLGVTEPDSGPDSAPDSGPDGASAEDGSGEVADGPTGGGPGEDCRGCSGTPSAAGLSLWAMVLWLRSTRRSRREPPPSPARGRARERGPAGA